METRKTALVLGGGGSRGAYEIGVWQALRELAINIDLVTGTSIGAINGAIVAQGTFDTAISLWEDTDTSMVFNTEPKDILSNSGVGINKIKCLLEQYIDEAAIRASEIDYGLVTAEFPSMTPKFLMKDQIPQGKLIDYLLASSSIFPVMKGYEIDRKTYIDGGYTDNLPYGLALDNGATHVIVVNLDAPGVVHKKRLKDIDSLKIIECPWDLGNILIFDKLNSKKIMRLGYLDTLKAFHVYDGSHYCFVKGEFDRRSLRGATAAGIIFELDPEKIYRKYVYNLLLNNSVSTHLASKEKEIQNYSNSLKGRLLEGFVKAKSALNRKSITVIIAQSLKEHGDTNHFFLSKPIMKLLREEILAASYLVKEGLI